MITRLPRLMTIPLLAALFAVVVVAPGAQAADVDTWEELDAALRAGGTVTVAGDIEGPGVMVSRDVATMLDLAGHTVTLEGVPAVDLTGTAELTVVDSVGGGMLDTRRDTDAEDTYAAVIGTKERGSTSGYLHAGALIVDGATVRATQVRATTSTYLQGAAVGGGRGVAGGDVTVRSGELIANASEAAAAAGIGGGLSGAGGSVAISGGVVKATGGSSGSGIGGGRYGAGGSVVISGGVVNATGDGWGSGIGGGDAGAGGSVVISGGVVNATGDGWGSGIGGGAGGDGGDLTVSGGTVTVTGGNWAAGIGSGDAGLTKGVEGGTVTMTGGNLTVTSGFWGAALGGGEEGAGGYVTFSGGRLEAIGRNENNTFGPGRDAAEGVERGSVKVVGTPMAGSATTVHGPSASPLTYVPGDAVVRVTNTVDPDNDELGTTVIETAATVTYDANGGTPEPTAELVLSGETASEPAPPTREGHSFAGWFDGDERFDFDAPVAGDTELVAAWNPHYYDIRVFPVPGQDYTDAFEVIYQGKITAPATPTRAGHDFTGWLVDGEPYNFSTPVTGDVDLVGSWDIHSYAVTFDAAGGSAIGAQSVEYGSSPAQPANPSRDGYTFLGWFVDGERFDFTAPVTGDVTLTARWERDTPAGPGPKPVTPVNLVDVSSNPSSPHYTQFHREISWLASTGVTRGWNMGDGKYEFRPKEEITREAMAAFMYRYAGSPKVVLPARSPFKDVTPRNTNFYKEIIWMNQQGISTGWNVTGGKEFRPKDAITRDAMAAFMYRFAGKPSTTAPSTSPFSDVTPKTQFYKEITWLAGTGISTGWKQTQGKPQYRPFDEISREAMAAFLYRFNQL